MTNPDPTKKSITLNSETISLAVATIGRTDEVKRLFDSLALQTYKNFEVILADQNLDDRLNPIVLDAIQMGLNVKHYKLDAPNQYAARTLGIKMAKGKYIAFPDDDCWYEEDTLFQAIDAFEKTNADLLIGLWLDANIGIEVNQGKLTWEEARNFRSVGCSMITQFYKTDSLRAIGGFDQRLGIGKWYGGGEDTDILFSTLIKGMKVLVSPQILVRHKFQNGIIYKANFKTIRNRARGAGALYAKHNVPSWVIFRGFVAPMFLPLLKLQFNKTLPIGIITSIGRIEGYVKWNLEESNRASNFN